MLNQKPETMNHLKNQTSPYLLQHLHNPVDWHPWGEEALEKGRRENKPLLVSIGYSACHWCHVMERESFEDEEVARLMNQFFVCIKVDREERPDIDHLYMNAVQIVSGQGGWPLNCFALPDGRPFWGGTYFPKQQWKNILARVAGLYHEQYEDVEKQAENLTKGVTSAGFVPVSNEKPEFGAADARRMFKNLMDYMDRHEGGTKGAPKFPLPNNFEFLLHYYHSYHEQAALDQVLLSLRKMAWGGIYDQIGGGFARYATDVNWKIPHFEKMLYDNGQLVSLYANAWKVSAEPLFREVVYETIDFVSRELTSPEGVFYSALDADSEGEEGKFYVWREREIDELLGADAPLIKHYYQVGKKGFWERGNNILLRSSDDASFAQSLDLKLQDLKKVVDRSKQKLMAARSKRVRPGLDDKVLVSWNALMIKGLADAYAAFAEEEFLDKATRAADFILQNAMQADGMVYRSLIGGKAAIPGFLEDYALLATALTRLYEVSQQLKYLEAAKQLAIYVLTNFSVDGTHLFAFSPIGGEKLAAPHYEFHDNVIPASNSVMARVLFYLANIYEEPVWGQRSSLMLSDMRKRLDKYSSSFSNWGMLLLHHIVPFFTVAIAGPEAVVKAKTLAGNYLPNAIVAAGAETGDIEKVPLLSRHYTENSLINVCSFGTCQTPVKTAQEALKQLFVSHK